MTEQTPSWVYLFLGFYFLTSGILFVYGVHAYLMAFLYLRALRKAPPQPGPGPLLPVTIQLPVYNERYVIGRLLEAVTRLDYPKDLVEIQVLDDSTDETVVEAAAMVARLKTEGWNAVHRHRRQRTGYKGGALREGLAEARGTLIAVFDADFLPPPGFLRETVPYFQDPSIGMVQTRWTHLNEGFSSLTRAQAAALDGHFLVEHTVRNRYGAFINFNGTAGIWRKECIQEAGDWQDDTLTEDLDLSYRAQLAGWKFLFLPTVECPAELPAEVNGLKGQQFRWAKGSAQTALKILPRVQSAPLPRFVRFEALVHLTNHLVYPLLLLLGILAFPALRILDHHPETGFLFRVATVLAVASFGHPWLYLVAQRARQRNYFEAWFLVALVVAGNMGIALNNTRALMEGLLGLRSDFNRTPKYALTTRGDHWRGKAYHPRASVWSFLEIAFALYSLIALGYALRHGHWLAVPFLAMYAMGAGTLGILSVYNAGAKSRRHERPAPALATLPGK